MTLLNLAAAAGEGGIEDTSAEVEDVLLMPIDAIISISSSSS